MATLRSLKVTGVAELENAAEEAQQPIRRAELMAELEKIVPLWHAPVTVAQTASLELLLAPGTQILSGRVRRKLAGLTPTEGALLETEGGLVVRLGTTANSAAPGTAIAGLQAAIASKAEASHGHAVADVAGLQEALDGKAQALHTHAMTEVTGLPMALAGKASTGHTHGNATPAGAGFMSATDKTRLDALAEANLWLPAVAVREHLPLAGDPLNAMRLVMSEGMVYRHVLLSGFVADQWARVGVSRVAGMLGNGVDAVLDFVHGLGTTDIDAVVRYATGSRSVVDADWAPFDPNTVRLTFGSAPASGSLRIVVFG
jgi:hypothetical protein